MATVELVAATNKQVAPRDKLVAPTDEPFVPTDKLAAATYEQVAPTDKLTASTDKLVTITHKLVALTESQRWPNKQSSSVCHCFLYNFLIVLQLLSLRTVTYNYSCKSVSLSILKQPVSMLYNYILFNFIFRCLFDSLFPEYNFVWYSNVHDGSSSRTVHRAGLYKLLEYYSHHQR